MKRNQARKIETSRSDHLDRFNFITTMFKSCELLLTTRIRENVLKRVHCNMLNYGWYKYGIRFSFMNRFLFCFHFFLFVNFNICQGSADDAHAIQALVQIVSILFKKLDRNMRVCECHWKQKCVFKPYNVGLCFKCHITKTFTNLISWLNQM